MDNSERGFDDLTLYLKQIAGVDVKGSGGDAIIQVRGMNSITAETRPLYVVNGNPIGNDYSEIYDMVNVDQVKTIRVLKSSVDTGLYGMRGSNGVIEIDMK
ncbi:MAG: TonB-dependent receptor plug domain-containing protein [Bacteroidota bacterium]